MQVLCGTSLAVGSFGLQVWLAPYRQPEANVLKAAVDLQIFLTFLVSFVLRALDATPASAAGLGLASFEPAFTQIQGGPAVFYGWVLVGSLGLVLALAVGLTMAQLQHRRRWLASTARGAELQQLAVQEDADVDLREATIPGPGEERRQSTVQPVDPTSVASPEMRRPSYAATRGGVLTQPLMPAAGGRSTVAGPAPAPEAATARVPAAVHVPAPEEAPMPGLEPEPEPESVTLPHM